MNTSDPAGHQEGVGTSDEAAHLGTFPSDCSPRIVQLLMAPQDATWQNRLLGLGSDGVTYSVSHKGFWEPFVPPLGVTENDEVSG